MKVLVKGFYGEDNLGDEAILWSVMRWVKSQGMSAVVSAGDKEERLHEVIAACGVDALLIRSGFKRELGVLNQVDAIVIGGGGLFPNDQPRFPITLLFLALYATIAGKAVAMLGIGVNPINHPLTSIVWKLLARLCRIITVRDDSSRVALQRVLGDDLAERKVHRFSDLALSLPVPAERSGQRRRFFAVVLARPWNDEELKLATTAARYSALIAGLADCVHEMEAAGYRVALVPFYLPNDRIFAEDLLKKLKPGSEAEIVADETISGRLQVLADSSAVLTMRFHGLVFGVLFHKPLVVISYDHKMESLCKELSLEGNMVTLGIRDSEFYRNTTDVDFGRLISVLSDVMNTGGPDYSERRDALIKLAGQSFGAVSQALNG